MEKKNSVISLLNKINSTNCFKLAKHYSKSEDVINIYAKSVLEYLNIDSEHHICNLIGICSLSFFWKRMSSLRPDNVEVPLSPSFLSKSNFLINYCNFLCIEYFLDNKDEGKFNNLLNFLFENIENYICLICLKKLIAFTFYKLSTDSPLLLQNIYEKYQNFPKIFTSLRHKFFYQDLDDLFNNKCKRTNPYLKDIQMIRSFSLDGDTLKTENSSNNFLSFFNTQLRKKIYNIISQSVNINDCFQSILMLNTSSVQWKEVFLILLYCSVKERPYNRFYFEVIKMILISNPKYSKFLKDSIVKILFLPKLVTNHSRHRFETILSDIGALIPIPQSISQKLHAIK